MLAYIALPGLLALIGWLVVRRPWQMPVTVTPVRDGGFRVDEAGLLGNYYPVSGIALGPGVLVLGGSEGGIHQQVDRDARALSQAGFSALSLSFFRGPGQRDSLALVPLELFDSGLDWLRSRPEVDGSRLAVVGMSKGAEAALLVAAGRPDLRAAIAAAPSSVTWPGFDWAKFRGLKDASWTRDGRPLPTLPYGRFSIRRGVRSIYERGLEALTDHPDAVIPIERARAAVLLFCGGADQVWPSHDMAEQLSRRSRERGGPPVTILSYPDANHGVFASPLKDGDKPRKFGFVRSARGNPAAQADSWSRALAFLREQLDGNGARRT